MSRSNKARVKKENDVLENYLKYGIDLYNRRIYFGDVNYPDGDGVDFSTISYVIRAIDKMLDVNEDEPIRMIFSSYGGDAYAMLTLVDKIQQSPCKFIFEGYGFIMSAGTWIMAVCDERYLSENSTIMVHGGSWGAEASGVDMEILAQEESRLDGTLYKLYADNSYMSKEFWAKVCQRDLYLGSKEVLELGLADAIVQPRKRGNFRRGIRRKTFSNPPTEQKMKKLVSSLYKRVKMDVPDNLTISIKKEEFEEAHPPREDNKEQLEVLGKKPEGPDGQKTE